MKKGGGPFGDATSNPTSKLGKFHTPFGVDFIDNMMIVSEHNNNRIQALDKVTGKSRWVSYNAEGDSWEWLEPYYLKADPTRGLIYVVNRTRDNIGVLDLQGNKKYTFGDGELNYPHELDVGSDGRIYIADSKNYRLVIYNSPDDKEYTELKFTTNWGYLKMVAVDKDDSLALGFTNGQSTYVLLLTTKKNSLKSPGKDVLLAKRKANINSLKRKSLELVKNERYRTGNLYRKYCQACHEEGSFNAPVRGNRESWDRFPRSISKLTELAMLGNGAMMPKGGCQECTSEDLVKLIKYLAPMNWVTGK